MKTLNEKINTHFAGKVVRKDLTKLVKGNAIVPTYVLEYLLGQYCATDDEETIIQGVETVKTIIAKHFVHREESQIIKSMVREKGSHRIIDKVAVQLNDRQDRYEASFANLGLTRIPISDSIIKEHQKLLSSGVWCILTLGYSPSDERDHIPWFVESLKPIQVSNVDIEEYKSTRKEFSKEEWIDMLMQSIGLNPSEFTFRSKLLQLTRLVPFVENNYNLIELGPKGTGKSHIYSEMSPHGILISGGEVSKAKLFVNNSSGEIGLVGYWDVVAYDEFAGKTKRVDRGLVDIMKNYMANKSFSRGTQVYGASASMVFVGNTDHSVAYMLKHSDLFDALPKDYYDTAFLDRMHAYLPGWEVQKLRNEMFTSEYGFIVDYLAEILKNLRKEDRTHDYTKFFELSSSITTRDKTSIAKTYAGLIKVIYPDDAYSEIEAKEILDFAIENRKRVKDQLRKMDETFEEVDFSYISKSTGESFDIETLEEIQYKPKPVVSEEDENQMVSNESTNKTQEGIQLNPGQKIIRDNQTGISYDNLFGAYLLNSSNITLVDPYIRLPYQLRNLMEFAKLIAEKKETDAEVKLHLVTSNNEDYIENVKEAFNQMIYSLESMGIIFSYEFDDFIHDRSITSDNGWKIILGRGLDIWQKTGGWYDISEYVQEQRICKACEITFVKG
ncbi:MAG: TIGR02688 family protein [Xanthomarina sp.]|uniref:BREX system Lon protease-like protein BrxL n=1 Tax=Xanthomarina sp. TaxID=1931211 RepID=UPI000C3DE650|nr:BREX system Lon protease-like protein BrxL [Xanthomarina sp.]MAL23052.1 TIGR02688 family protein [Xanthomarina sp.]MBF61767.1 TIGR02688 family protein [Xanthomarina sp.]HAB26808.1 BREX system Lon protease-like protein BrxL [Xanthomarina gelatinilytica]